MAQFESTVHRSTQSTCTHTWARLPLAPFRSGFNGQLSHSADSDMKVDQIQLGFSPEVISVDQNKFWGWEHTTAACLHRCFLGDGAQRGLNSAWTPLPPVLIACYVSCAGLPEFIMIAPTGLLSHSLNTQLLRSMNYKLKSIYSHPCS